MRNKHYALIEEWARTGKQVESRLNSDDPWQDCLCKFSPQWDPGLEYRLKPKAIKCKLFLIHDFDEDKEALVIHNQGFKPCPTDYKNFIRWIDSDWQEYEV